MVETKTSSYIDPRTIPNVTLSESQQTIVDKIVNMTTFMFNSKRVPVRIVGFLIEGDYQTGKTEIGKQAIKELKETFTDLKFSFNDAAGIAAPAFGESEKLLSDIFAKPYTQNGTFHRVIVLDDIDCLFFGRDIVVAQSWHISLNSVLFHELDALDPRMTIVIGTTNKPDIVDGALRSRLVSIKVPSPSVDDLRKSCWKLIHSMKLPKERETQLSLAINNRIVNAKGYRDIQQYIIEAISEMSVDG